MSQGTAASVIQMCIEQSLKRSQEHMEWIHSSYTAFIFVELDNFSRVI